MFITQIYKMLFLHEYNVRTELNLLSRILFIRLSCIHRITQNRNRPVLWQVSQMRERLIKKPSPNRVFRSALPFVVLTISILAIVLGLIGPLLPFYVLDTRMYNRLEMPWLEMSTIVSLRSCVCASQFEINNPSVARIIVSNDDKVVKNA